MKIWTLLTSTAALVFASGFFLLGAPQLPAKAPRIASAGIDTAREDDGNGTRAARRYRQSLSNHWRAFVLR